MTRLLNSIPTLFIRLQHLTWLRRQRNSSRRTTEHYTEREVETEQKARGQRTTKKDKNFCGIDRRRSNNNITKTASRSRVGSFSSGGCLFTIMDFKKTPLVWRISACLPLLLVSLVLMPKVGQTLQCYECSDFPREVGSLDENFGPCPGWLRPPKYYGLSSLYDACMTVKLVNGTILAQNAVIYKQCLGYRLVVADIQFCSIAVSHVNCRKHIPKSLRPVSGARVRIKCCRRPRCNAPKRFHWPKEQQMRAKMDEPARESIANSQRTRGTKGRTKQGLSKS